MNSDDLRLMDYLLGFVSEKRIEKIDSILNDRTKHVTVVLEDIYHPQNASAVVRTCDCYGIQDLHVIENTNSYKVNKCVTQGAGKWISLYRYNGREDNTEDCIMKLKDQGFHIAATSLQNKDDVSIEELPVEKKIALCFGSEELGLSDKAHDLADSIIRVPMYGFTQSFNVSVCAALCLNNLIKRLHNSDTAWRLTDDERNVLRLDWIMKSIKKPDMLLTRFK